MGTEYGVMFCRSINWRGGQEWHLYCRRCPWTTHEKYTARAERAAALHERNAHPGQQEEVSHGDDRAV